MSNTLCYYFFIHFSCTVPYAETQETVNAKIFLEEVIKGFLWVSNFQLQDFLGRKIFVFFGWLDLWRNFLGIQNNLKICGGVCISWPRSSAVKVQPKMFCFL